MANDCGETTIVLVVGATGRLGRLLVEQFTCDGWRVRAFARQGSIARDLYSRHRGVDVVEGELTSPETLRSACDGCSLVIFAAGARRAAYHVDPQSVADFQAVNVAGLRELGRAVVNVGQSPLVHLGSLFSLGILQTGILTEQTPALPSTPFEQSEWQGEQELLTLHKSDGLDCRIMRLPPVTGAIPRGGLLDILGAAATDPTWDEVFRCNSESTKPLISPSSFLSAVRHVALRGLAGRIYHFSSGDFSLRQMTTRLQKQGLRDRPVSDNLLSAGDHSNALSAFILAYAHWNVSVPTVLAKEELGWRPSES